MKTISLNFQGYWLEAKKNGIPNESGIYCVYTGTPSKDGKTVTLRSLIYVGESDNVRKRLREHERLSDWKKYLNHGETLCYSFASVTNEDRKRAEAALIYHHKPPCNTEYKNAFPFEDTTVKTSGKNKFLDSSFTVQSTR